MADNKSSLWNVLLGVLSVGNKEANMSYPPGIFSIHYNTVTSFLLNILSQTYPKHVDVLQPFINTTKLPITDGKIRLPGDYRNLLGAPGINARPDGTECSEPIKIDTAAEFKVANLKGACKSYPIIIKSKSEWDDLTTSTYAYPTIYKPIGMFIGNGEIKICPAEVSKVEVMYVKNESIYTLKYIMQPDDTYIPDGDTNTQWGDNAYEYLFKGCLALYGAYQRDQNIQNWSTFLNQQGLL